MPHLPKTPSKCNFLKINGKEYTTNLQGHKKTHYFNKQANKWAYILPKHKFTRSLFMRLYFISDLLDWLNF